MKKNCVKVAYVCDAKYYPDCRYAAIDHAGRCVHAGGGWNFYLCGSPAAQRAYDESTANRGTKKRRAKRGKAAT